MRPVWQLPPTRSKPAMRDPMPKDEWGVKRVCPETGKRFYDLGRSPIISPYTGKPVEIDLPGRKGPVGGGTTGPAKEKRVVAEIETDEDLLVEDEAADLDIEDDLLEDEEDDNVALDDLADVAGEDDDT
jgi:uncharacterized protein (TIGR02300 family)